MPPANPAQRSTPSDPLARVLAALAAVRQSGASYGARCPAHEDRQASLSIAVGTDGRVLVKCHAGCSAEQIVAAAGLTLGDLFPDSRRAKSGRAKTGGLTVEQLAAAKRLDPVFLAGLGIRSERGLVVVPYHDADGNVAAIRRRHALSGARFTWRRGDRPTLYGLDRLRRQDGPVLVVEGESDCWALWSVGINAVGVPGKATWRPEFASALRGREVYVWQEPDAADFVSRVAADLPDVRVIVADEHKDPADVHASGADLAEYVKQRMATARPAAEIAAAERERRLRERLGAAAYPTLAATLAALVTHLRRFVWFARPEQAVAVALWCAHAHALPAVEQSPILAVPSPAKRSGKSRLLEVISTVVPRPWRIERPSEAVLFRRIARDQPTVLLDEADTIFSDTKGQYEGIRALYNAGNRRGTAVSRVVPKGREFELVDFPIFAPKAAAGIGRFPETLIDRSVVITMSRRAPDEPVDRLRARQAEALGRPIREALEAHMAALLEGVDGLTLPDDALPDVLDDRAQDNWEALLAIAGIAGGDWPRLAHEAAIVLRADRTTADDNAGLTLLADLHTIFGERPFVTTAELLEELAKLDTSPWSEWSHGKPLTARGLARLLDPFGVRPDRNRTVRGYSRLALADAWKRYVLPPPGNPSQASQASPRVQIEAVAMTDGDGKVTGRDGSHPSPEEALPERGVTHVTHVTATQGVGGDNGSDLSWGAPLAPPDSVLSGAGVLDVPDVPVPQARTQTAWSWDGPLCDMCGRRMRLVTATGDYLCPMPHGRPL